MPSCFPRFLKSAYPKPPLCTFSCFFSEVHTSVKICNISAPLIVHYIHYTHPYQIPPTEPDKPYGHTSIPNPPNRTRQTIWPTAFSRPLRIVNINFQSCKNKLQELQHIAHSVKPDVIIGTETWLQPSITSNEIFKPEMGLLYRKDRSNQSYGVVLIAVRSELVCSACPDLDTDCELLWVQIDLTGAKSLNIGALYRQPDSDVTTLETLNQSLQRLTHRTNGNIWLGGDFNAPHINWPLLEVTPLAGTKRQIDQRLIDISLHHNIEQIIDKPTRGDNILDLFLTNNKSALRNFETLPPIGKADHDIVYIEINARPNRQNTPQRNVFIFRNANWDGIKSKLDPSQLHAKHY